MANKENLVQNSGRSRAEVKKINRKGGIKSGEVRRKKKEMRDAMSMILSLPVANEKNLEVLQELGVSQEDADNQTLMLVVAMKKAMQGDMRAIEYITSLTTMNASDKEKYRLEKQRIKLERDKLRTPTQDKTIQDSINAIDGIVSQMQNLGEDE